MIHCPHDDFTDTPFNDTEIVRICNGCGKEMVYRRTESKKDVEKRWKE